MKLHLSTSMFFIVTIQCLSLVQAADYTLCTLEDPFKGLAEQDNKAPIINGLAKFKPRLEIKPGLEYEREEKRDAPVVQLFEKLSREEQVRHISTLFAMITGHDEFKVSTNTPGGLQAEFLGEPERQRFAESLLHIAALLGLQSDARVREAFFNSNAIRSGKPNSMLLYALKDPVLRARHIVPWFVVHGEPQIEENKARMLTFLNDTFYSSLYHWKLRELCELIGFCDWDRVRCKIRFDTHKSINVDEQQAIKEFFKRHNVDFKESEGYKEGGFGEEKNCGLYIDTHRSRAFSALTEKYQKERDAALRKRELNHTADFLVEHPLMCDISYSLEKCFKFGADITAKRFATFITSLPASYDDMAPRFVDRFLKICRLMPVQQYNTLCVNFWCDDEDSNGIKKWISHWKVFFEEYIEKEEKYAAYSSKPWRRSLDAAYIRQFLSIAGSFYDGCCDETLRAIHSNPHKNLSLYDLYFKEESE